MSRRLIVGGVVAAVCLLLVVSTVGASQDSSERTTGGAGAVVQFTVVEHALTDLVIDLGATGDSIGDTLAFGNPVFNAANTKKIGRDEGSCVRTNPGKAWECSWTNLLPGGHITVQGPFNDDGSDSVLSITGGTGKYADVDGDMLLHWRNPGGTEFDFTFRLHN
jgi:allene oxide cyclase